MSTQPHNVPTIDLVALALGELSAARQAEIMSLAAQQPELAAQLDQIRGMIATLREGALAAPSAHAISKAMDIWQQQQRPSVGAWLADAADRIMGVVFDSGAAPALAGFRGASDSRHLTFSQEGIEIDLLVETEEGRAIIRGQVAGAKALEAGAFAPGTDSLLARALADDGGGFCLDLEPAACDLRVRTESGVLMLRGVIGA